MREARDFGIGLQSTEPRFVSVRHHAWSNSSAFVEAASALTACLGFPLFDRKTGAVNARTKLQHRGRDVSGVAGPLEECSESLVGALSILYVSSLYKVDTLRPIPNHTAINHALFSFPPSFVLFASYQGATV